MASHERESTAEHEPRGGQPEPQGEQRDGKRKKYIYALAIAIIALFLIIYLV